MDEKERHYLAGIDHFGEDRFDQAIEEYQKALLIDPSYVDALLALGMACHHKGLLDKAIEVTQRAVEINPNEVMAYSSLSMFFQEKGMIKEAEEWQAKARMLSWKQELGKEPQ
ncbi:MAG: tetratricopeptide repeat protein [Deltaproteobacteria bacterium]|nr:tetratricopeptide repeat protein [Deltaproteobacteria bacterium]